MHPLLAGTVGESARWLGTELFPFLVALLLNMAACLAVLALVVFVVGIITVILCAMIDAAMDQAAEDESPRPQTGEGLPDAIGEGSPKT